MSRIKSKERREERRGRPAVSECNTAAFRCDKCSLAFMTKKAKKKHVSQEHRI